MRVCLGYALVMLAALMWGCVGVFSRALGSMGLSPMEVATLRMVTASILLAPILVAKGLRSGAAGEGRRDAFAFFRITGQSAVWCILVGIFGLAFASAAYYTAIDRIGMSTASTLMCTSPMFGIVLGRLLYGEGITAKKVASLCCNVTGCILAVGGGSFGMGSSSPFGVFMGVMAGLMGCLLTMFSKRATRGVEPLTVVFYGFVAGAVVMLIVANPAPRLFHGMPPEFVLTLLVFGLVPTVLAYLCYMTGLSYGLEASRVPVIASLETATATVIGIGLLGESMSMAKMAGIALVLISIVCMSCDMSAQARSLAARLSPHGECR